MKPLLQGLRGSALSATLTLFSVAAVALMLSRSRWLLLGLLPALLLACVAQAWLARQRTGLPVAEPAQAACHMLLAAQLPRVAEEMLERGWEVLPALHGDAPMSPAAFLGVHVALYAAGALACHGVFERRWRPALLPLLFLVLAGGWGSVLLHSAWACRVGGYVPGLLSAQLQWLLAPWALRQLCGSAAAAWRLAALCTVAYLPALLLMG